MSNRTIPNPGTYPAKAVTPLRVYKTDEGALCCAILVAVLGSDVAWQGKHTVTLGKKSGELQTKTIDNLKRIFGWDGQNPFDLEDMDVSAIEFEIEGEHSAYTPPGDNQEERTVFKIRYMNPPGGGANMPEAVGDRKTVLAEWGSKFKAHSASKPAPKPAGSTASAAPKAATPKPASSGPPGRRAPSTGSQTTATARTATQEEVWQALIKANPGADEATLGEKYYAIQDELFPDANGQLDPQQWGQVATKLGL